MMAVQAIDAGVTMADMSFDPSIVSGCGHAADDAAAAVVDLNRNYPGTDSLLGSHGAFNAAQATRSCQTAWSGRIGDDATATQHGGDFLLQAVRDHLGADEGNAAGIHAAGGRVRAE
jgi:hypothetical protein